VSYLYKSNLDPLDRRDQLEIQLDSGSSALLRRGHYYDLSLNELTRARQYAVMELSSESANEDPIGIVRLPIKGNPYAGQVPVWDAAQGAFIPTSIPALEPSGATGGALLTVDECKAFAQNVVPINRGADPAYLGILGASLDLSTYGAPASGVVLWPDGGLGKFVALTIIGGGGPNPSTVEEYTVTHRTHVDTSATDRTTWVPTSPTSFTPISDVAAAALVTRTPETWSQNVARNAYVPSNAELANVAANQWSVLPGGSGISTENPYIAYVTGRSGISNPTTDELLQWASHKWGIPTDRLRAQAHLESRWDMDFLGDRFNVESIQAGWRLLYPVFSRVVGSATDVYQSVGIMQCKWSPDNELGPGSEPLRWKSTAFNIDYCCSWIRFHLDNPLGRRAAWSDSSYVAGDYVHAQSGWFQPYPWLNSGQLGYQANVESRLSSKPWLLANFTNVSGLVKLYHQPPVTRNVYGFITARPEVVVSDWLPPTVPTAAPTGAVAVAGDGSITVSWNLVADADNGGAPLLGYVLTETDEGWSVVHNYNLSGFTFGGLPNGVAHRFTVAAFNEVGTGPASASSNAATPTIPPPPTVPGAPTAVHGSPGNGSVALLWTAPTSNGGAAITSYRITPYLSGVAQTPVIAPVPQTAATISGLTNGQAYTFKVAAINSAGAGSDSAASSAITPELPAVPIPANMPIVSRGLPATSTQPAGQAANLQPAAALNNVRADQWNSINPPSVSAPARLRIDLRTLADAQLSSVWAVLHNQSAPGTVAPGTTNPSWYGMPKTFRLLGHTSSGSQPVDTDVGWTEILAVSNPSSSCVVMTGASNAGLNLSTYNWLMIEVTATWQSGESCAFNFDLRDVRNGHDDCFFFYGDSWIFEGVRSLRPDNPAWRTGAIEGLIEAAVPSRNWPIIQPAGTGGWRADIADDAKADYIGQTKAKIVVLAFGANDANAAGLDLNTVGGTSSTYAQAYKTHMQAMVTYAVGLGKFVLIPSPNYHHSTAWAEANLAILNTMVDEVLAANPNTTLRGADIYGFFKAHQELLRDSGAGSGDQFLHPSYDTNDAAHQYQGRTGYEWYQQLWSDFIIQTFYTAPGATVPGVPSNVTGTAGDGSVALDWDAPFLGWWGDDQLLSGHAIHRRRCADARQHWLRNICLHRHRVDQRDGLYVPSRSDQRDRNRVAEYGQLGDHAGRQRADDGDLERRLRGRQPRRLE
jgi:hypothetical protein